IPATESVSGAGQDGREKRREEDKEKETPFYCLPLNASLAHSERISALAEVEKGMRKKKRS
ncbi:hypothetical protein Tco_1557789, partial [Tanacetum coccineum]